ncbi:MAG TPA: hypothetical protein PK677_04020 [Acidiphilium sp.]|nr:hypothetical protein [Acidiphilium sp.]HQU22830.1 hypothetical protein [Acidiphilium sp.]
MDRDTGPIIDMQPDGSFTPPPPKAGLGTVIVRLAIVGVILVIGISLLWAALVSAAVMVLGGLALYGFWRFKQSPLMRWFRGNRSLTR